MFTNPNDTSTTTPPSVEVWTKEEVQVAIPVYESVHSVNGRTGNVVVTAEDVALDNGDTLEDVIDNIGPKVVSEVIFKQDTGNPVVMKVTTRHLDGSAESSVESIFSTVGHIGISYDAVTKEVIFENKAVGLHVGKITGSFTIPEPCTLFVWNVVPAAN
jgi:hypothetical protein